jgi:hypothetical protein
MFTPAKADAAAAAQARWIHHQASIRALNDPSLGAVHVEVRPVESIRLASCHVI